MIKNIYPYLKKSKCQIDIDKPAYKRRSKSKKLKPVARMQNIKSLFVFIFLIFNVFAFTLEEPNTFELQKRGRVKDWFVEVLRKYLEGWNYASHSPDQW